MADLEKCKDCASFVPIKDGTLAGDWKYCDLSFQCKQVGMRADSVVVMMPDGNREYELLCTGNHIKTPDDKNIEKAK